MESWAWPDDEPSHRATNTLRFDQQARPFTFRAGKHDVSSVTTAGLMIDLIAAVLAIVRQHRTLNRVPILEDGSRKCGEVA